MRARTPITWWEGDDGIIGRVNVWTTDDPEFLIESQMVEDDDSKQSVYYFVRIGEGDLYIHNRRDYGVTSVREAMCMAERFRYEKESEWRERAHPWRTLFERLVHIDDLQESGFKLWLRKQYGPLPFDRSNEKDQRLELFDRLLNAEVLKRHHAEAANTTRHDSPA